MFSADISRPPTRKFADYPLRVDGTTMYEPQSDPPFTLLTERFINNNDSISDKRKELELKRLQNPTLGLKFEIEL